MKKEARIAHFEALAGGNLLAVIFRGGWIDGLSTLTGGGGGIAIAKWLEGSKYLEELRGVSLGKGMGAAEAGAVRRWAKSRGLPEVSAGERNRRQARVLAEGFDRFLEGKG